MSARKFGYIFSVAVVASLATPTLAKESDQVAELFGARESIKDISLSPDGTGLAYVGPGEGSSEVLFVADIAGDATPRPIIRVSNQNEDLDWCRWANDARLVCHVSIIVDQAGQLIGYDRMFSIAADGNDVRQLTREGNLRSLGILQHGGAIVSLDVAGEEDKILMTRQWVPESTVGTILANKVEGLGVDEVDIVSGRNRTVERAHKDAIRYIADETGTVRLMASRGDTASGYATDAVRYDFRRRGTDDWAPLLQARSGAQQYSGFYPAAVSAAQDVVYGFDDLDGRNALYSVSLDGENRRDLLLAREDVDVDQLIRLGRKSRVVGVSYAAEKRIVEFFDPELKSLASSLRKALGGLQIELVGASENEDKLLLAASSDVEPGMIYLFDKTSGKLAPVLPLRPELEGRKLGTMKPVVFPASDGTQIPGYLTLPVGSDGKGLPAIVLPHGGPSARDEWGFDWLVQYFAAQGYAVLQPNFRGSSGYGSSWFADNGFRSWRMAVGDVNDAGRWLVEQGIADPSKLAIVGWSYGGYAALQSQVVAPDLYKAVVAIAPVTDLERLRDEHRRFTDFMLVDEFIGEGAHVIEGSPARNVENFASPVLLFHGDLDQNVGVGESRLMENRLRNAGKSVKYVEFKGLDHYIDDGVRRPEMLREIASFLKSNLGR